MYRKIKILSVSIIVAFFLAGCQEVEKPGQDVPEKEIPKVEIEKKVDFSDVYAPPEVSVYSASLWEAEDDYVVKVFLGDKKVEKILYAQGPRYAHAKDTKEEEGVNVFDGGESCYGYNKGLEEAGVSYGYMKYLYFEKLFSEYEKIRDEYYGRGEIISKELDETGGVFVEAKEKVSKYLEKLHMENYEVDAAAVFEESGKKGCLIYWTQMIDDIPVSKIKLDKSGSQGDTTVYNSKLSYNVKMEQRGSRMETKFVNKKLVSWQNYNAINTDKKLKQSPVVPVEEAYKKVEEQIPNYPLEVRKPILEMVELQYKIIELDEKIYLYPVWTFCISTEEKEQEDADTTEGETYTTYNYFLIDAVTGDYFTDIDTKELEG